MSNPSGPEQPEEPADQSPEEPGDQSEHLDEQQDDSPVEQEDHPTEQVPTADPEHEPATEVLSSSGTEPDDEPTDEQAEQRRFTAPSGFDAGSTQKIDPPPEPETEVFAMPPQPKPAAPQMIPPRGEPPKPPHSRNRSWGWVAALILVIAALVAVAVLGTVLLTRGSDPRASQEDMVRSTIEQFDVAIQNGDLATLRSITCGNTRDNYVRYDEEAWTETHARVAAAKQYPVVASIDQVIVNGNHAEANVTSFMAYAPQTRSTRSFDLEFRDEQWKICQAPQ